ncbi:MAG: 7TM diverse intracellular signaling domain-containing protein [Campylobacterota bacterium]
MFKILIFLSIFTFLNASTIELNYIDKKIEDFNISYLVDKNSSHTIQTIRNMQFNGISNRHAFSGKIGTTWYKIDLKNITKVQKEVFLHNRFAYFSREINIFEFSNGKQVNQERYNILEEKSSNKLTGNTLVYEMMIPPKSESTIFIKNSPMVSSLFNLNIYDKKSSTQALVDEHFYSIVIISIMLTLAFYNATLYFFNKRKEFLFYALYMVTPAIGLMYKYGLLFSHFHFYGEKTYWFNITAILMAAFLALFLKQVLNTKEMNKKIDHLLNSVLYLVMINVAIALVIDLTFAIEVFKYIFVYTLSIVLYLGYYLFKTSHPLAKIFSIAYLFYMSGMIITILAMSGAIEMNFFTFHSGGIGLIIEGLLFSYLMHYNIKILEQKIRDQKEIIISKNKKAQLGDMISAITHQWKQPLSRITSITSLLEFKIGKNSKIPTKELSEKISQINSNTVFLSDTIDDFKDFFNPSVVAKECDVAVVIQKAIELSVDDTMTKEITISTDLNFTKKISIYKNELLHIILNILQNSKEAFKRSENEIKIIKIIGYMQDEKIYIDIIDNAGGIDEESLPFIFNEHYTTKEKKPGSGIGLYLSKIILEDHLKGSIEVKNINDGAMFRIIL